jgi:hypothetical protein
MTNTERLFQNSLSICARQTASVGLPVWTIRENIGRGALKAKQAGRQYIVLPEALNAWLKSLEDVEPSPSYLRVARQPDDIKALR